MCFVLFVVSVLCCCVLIVCRCSVFLSFVFVLFLVEGGGGRTADGRRSNNII